MKNTSFLKNPILRNKFECELVEPCGNSLEEIKDNTVVSAGFNTWNTYGTIWSELLGNEGKVCTATVECQSNCRS